MEKEEKIKLKEEKKKLKEKNKQEKLERKKQKLPKEISQDLLKGIVKNIVIATVLMLYFFTLNVAITTMSQDRLMDDLKIFAGGFLILGIYLFEVSYKKDSGKKAISGIEAIVVCAHTLSIMHVITKFNYDFKIYMLTSSYVFAIYYVLKSIIMYTRGRKEYLNSLSDIHEILQDEPIKKEAIKRKKYDEENSEEVKDIKKDKENKEEKDVDKNKQIVKEEKPKTNKKKTTKTNKPEEKTTTTAKKKATTTKKESETKNKKDDDKKKEPAKKTTGTKKKSTTTSKESTKTKKAATAVKKEVK